jgi:hypothetical protein
MLALCLCAAMLGCGVFVFMPRSLAQGFFGANPFRQERENVVETLLNLPAPPPPNPLDPPNARDESFYDPKKPPVDDAPIDDLIDYWSHQSEGYRGALNYIAKPSEKVSERLLDAIQSDPSKFTSLSNVIPDNDRSAAVLKEVYDGLGQSNGNKDMREGIRNWLKMNSSIFADDLERTASATRDSGGYVSLENENNVLALTKHDWERAKPIVDRMYNDTSNPVTKVLGTWALYKHALLNNDAGDVDRYRSELMKTVEDKTLSDGVRDKANDAIAHEVDFTGRDDWTFSLFEDESLVKMDRFTMLTTLIMYDPPDKHVAKLVGLLDSKSKLTRYGAVRCLMIVADRVKDPAIVRGMLPWIQDASWVDIEPDNNNRVSIVNQLSNLKMPEAVPALIAALDEKATRTVGDENEYSNSNLANANMAVNAARRVWTSNSSVKTATNFNSNVKTRTETFYPLQDAAIRALAFQADPRAVPALRRLLAQTKEDYKVEELLRAIFACGGYSVAEQVEGLEYFAAASADMVAAISQIQEQFPANSYSNAANTPVRQYVESQYADFAARMQGNRRDPKFQLGMMVAANDEPSIALASAVVDRIEVLEKKDAALAQTLRQIIIRWNGLAISTLLLRDLKNGKADSATIVRLLSERKSLREDLAGEVAAVRTGPPIAMSTGACILDDARAYRDILEGKDLDARVALYACARLIRANLSLESAATDIKSENALLKSAAELYLESEDSPQARSIVLAQHAGEAKILGATMYFKGRNDSSYIPQLEGLFSSVNGYAKSEYGYGYGSDYDPAELGKLEERLQKEVKQDADLNGVYAYQDSFVRLYNDRVAFSWEDDPSRYHERNLSKEEFDLFKNYLAANDVGEMKPFVSCSGGCGERRELLMLGRNGGTRIFLRNQRTPPFFAGLERIFAEFRSQPSAVKYALSKEIPGLELLYANDDLTAETVWKQGNDLRVVVGDSKIRESIDTEVTRLEEAEQRDNSDEEVDPDDESDTAPAPEAVMPSQRMRLRRQFDEYTWRTLENGQLGASVSQPNGVEYIPLKDAFDTQPRQEQWKARSPGVEIRVGFDGLYKVGGGRLTKLLSSDLSMPVISSNGRWVVARRFSEEEGDVSVIRYNLLTKRSYKVEVEGYGELRPSCYIASLGKFLLVSRPYSDEEYSGNNEDDEEEESADEPRSIQYYLLDADTGVITPTAAEVRPLIQQTFRPLQSTGRPNEYWAALSFNQKHETVVGKYDSRLLKFTPVRKLPKINFNSMRMWIDEAEGKIYFVYNGHVLRLPLN